MLNNKRRAKTRMELDPGNDVFDASVHLDLFDLMPGDVLELTEIVDLETLASWISAFQTVIIADAVSRDVGLPPYAPMFKKKRDEVLEVLKARLEEAKCVRND